MSHVSQLVTNRNSAYIPHMSLGAKHSIYKKPGMSRKEGRYHVDIFLDLERILIDGEVIYKEGDFVV